MLCTACFNIRIAQLVGVVDFENIRLAPVKMIDYDGKIHVFHFQIRLLGREIALNAFELCRRRPDGYRFRLIGNCSDDLFVLLGHLIERIRRALHVKHIDFPGGQIINRTLRGRIEQGESQLERLPVVVIDGKELSWDNFGLMLRSMAGRQFRLDIADLSEEL